MTTDNFSQEFFAELSRIRNQNPRLGGLLPLILIEKFGSKKIAVQFYPPDPLTSHSEYFYDARLNALYKRKSISNLRAVWKQVATV